MIVRLHPNRCPHCGQRALTFMQKVKQGPALPSNCRVCRRPLVVPYWGGLTAVPFILALLGGFLLGNMGLYLLVTGTTLVLMILARWLLVPLTEAPKATGKGA